MDEIFIKNGLIKILKINYSINIVVNNKNISIYNGRCIAIDLSNKIIADFINSIYENGYKFDVFDCLLDIYITNEKQIDFF